MLSRWQKHLGFAVAADHRDTAAAIGHPLRPETIGPGQHHPGLGEGFYRQLKLAAGAAQLQIQAPRPHASALGLVVQMRTLNIRVLMQHPLAPVAQFRRYHHLRRNRPKYHAQPSDQHRQIFPHVVNPLLFVFLSFLLVSKLVLRTGFSETEMKSEAGPERESKARPLSEVEGPPLV